LDISSSILIKPLTSDAPVGLAFIVNNNTVEQWGLWPKLNVSGRVKVSLITIFQQDNGPN